MSTQTRTQLARILRRLNQGLMSERDAYKAVCDLLSASPIAQTAN